MKGLIIVLLAALLVIGALYTTGIFNNQEWWKLPGRSTTATGKVTTTSKTVNLQGARTVAVALNMGAGKMHLNGGSTHLMDAVFSYNNPAWTPAVSYDVTGGTGRLSVQQPNSTTRSWNSTYRNDWDLSFAGTVLLDLQCKIGAGTIAMDLSKMQVRQLTVDSGAATTTITASPAAMTEMTVKEGVGNTTLDLSGDWKNSADISVQGGVGSTRVTVPQNTGVIMNIRRGVGSVSAPGFASDGTSYRNDSYGKTSVTLTLDINVGVGSVTIVQK